jgi:signal peptidase I
MLEVTGYGNINLGSDTIEVHNEPIGDIVIFNKTQYSGGSTRTITLETQYADVGDIITISDGIEYTARWKVDDGIVTGVITSVSGTGEDNSTRSGATLFIHSKITPISVSFGTATTISVSVSYTLNTSEYGTIYDGAATITCVYDGDSTLTISRSVTLPSHFASSNASFIVGDVILASSQSTLGNPLYIDLDIGEAYKIENDVPVSVNNGIVMPAELPTLTPGTNTITFDNTITRLDIVPRWWKI